MAIDASTNLKERLALSVLLPLIGQLSAVLAATLLSFFRIPIELIGLLSIAIMPCALFGGAVSIPRCSREPSKYSISRLVIAAVAGMGTALASSAIMMTVGLDIEALSHRFSTSAVVEEAIVFVFFYGSMFTTAFVVLGIPNRTGAHE